MKNKKGFLLAEETLKIIIAVISIGFLVYFLTALYFANQGNKELEQAEASLEFLIKEINSLEEDEIRDVEIYNPENWFLASFPLDKSLLVEPSSKSIPDYCSESGWSDCLCICEINAADLLVLDFLAGDCDNKDRGICIESDFKVEDEKRKIELRDLPITLQTQENKIFLKSEK